MIVQLCVMAVTPDIESEVLNDIFGTFMALVSIERRHGRGHGGRIAAARDQLEADTEERASGALVSASASCDTCACVYFT